MWHDEYMKDFYLKNRESLAFFSNCTFGLKDNFGFELINAALENPPPVVTSRVPGLESDSLELGGEGELIVACQGQFYVLENGVSAEIIQEIMRDATHGNPEPQVGWLTTLPRSKWASYYHKLGSGAEAIAKSKLFVALDYDHYPQNDAQLAEQLAHGNMGNRWFDQSLQMILFGNGRAGFNTEHTVFDAVPAGDYIQAIADWIPGQARDDNPVFRKITWPREQWLLEAIQAAKNYVAGQLSKREIVLGAVVGKHGDAQIQMAIQLATQKHFGECRVTSEAVNMAHFPGGRYGTIFFDSPESVKYHKEKIKSCKAGDAIALIPCDITTSNVGFHEAISLIGYTDTEPNIMGICYFSSPTESVFHIKSDGKYLGHAKSILNLIDHFLKR